MLTLALPLLLLLIGLPLLFLGWRGRVVGAQPVCRRCGFDLTGLPVTSANCPECGSDLRKPHATRIGQLVRRRGTLWSGAILLFMALVGGGFFGLVVARDANFNPYKPLWMLVREVGSSDPTVSQPAMREITARMAAGKMTDAKVQEFAEAALQLQGNTNLPWVPEWGDFIETVRANGKLSDVQWTRYMKQAPRISIEVRPSQDRSSTTLPYWIVRDSSRVGTSTRFQARLESVNQSVWVNNLPVPPENGSSTSSGGINSSGTSKSGRSVNLAPLLSQLKDGPQTLRVKGTLDVLDAKVPSGAPPLMSIPFDLTANWTLLPGAGGAIKLKKDESLRPAVEKAVTVQSLSLQDFSDGIVYLSVNLNVANLPVGIGFDIIVRQGGREWNIGRLATPAVAAHHGFGTGAEAKGFDRSGTPTVDVILRPSTAAAAATTDTFEIWDGEIVIKDVKVELPPPPAPAPAKGTTGS